MVQQAVDIQKIARIIDCINFHVNEDDAQLKFALFGYPLCPF